MTRPRRANTRIFLLLTALVCGALIMVIEVLGSRVIGPFFGVSLFIWTSLIAVTLISLALGYWLGGVLADRRGTPETLYGIIIFAGVLVLLIPVLKSPILKLSVPLGLRLGSFVSTSLLFGPSLFLLGCVSPYLIKIATEELKDIGKTVGGFYALSTLGSVIGTAVTGFFLIAWLGVDSIFRVVGAALILLGVSYFLLFRKSWVAVAAILVPFLIQGQKSDAEISRLMDNGTRVDLVASHESYYGSIKVVDYTYRDQRLRELIIDGLIQGGVDGSSYLSAYEYSYFLQFLPYAMNPDGKRCLMIGLGAGVIPRWYESRGITTDAVDIDPAVFEVAEQYFDLKLQGDKFVQDARYFLQTATRTYDYIILDVFNGDTTPAHLLSQEALALIRDRLDQNGILGINLVGSLGGNSFMTASVVKTLESIFDQVEIVPTFDLGGAEQSGNLAILAYMGPVKTADLSKIRDSSIHPMANTLVNANLQKRFRFPESQKAILLTDDYNPIDFFDADLKESVRRDILESTNWDILLHSN